MGSMYSKNYYASQQTTSVESADVVIPEVLRLFDISSVIDFGCGVGGWLAAFQKHGVTDVLGIDGDYVPRDMLHIRRDQFLAMDLTAIQKPDRKFDLACSLEVAEHLPEESSDQLVGALVAAAPIVLFSAAIPSKGGVHHVNEQWQSYWAEKFARHAYVAIDCIRPLIHQDARVEWWYRQNTLIYCERDRVPNGHQPAKSSYELNRIDHAMVRSPTMVPGSGKEAIANIRRSLPVLGRALSRSLSLR